MAFNPLGLGLQHFGQAFGGVIFYTSGDDAATTGANQILSANYFRVNASKGEAGYTAEFDAIRAMKDFIRSQQAGEDSNEYGVPIIIMGNQKAAAAVQVKRCYINESAAGQPIVIQ